MLESSFGRDRGIPASTDGSALQGAGSAAKASRPKHFRLHRLWAVDFDWKPGMPFDHHRARKDRRLKTVSDSEFVYERGGSPTSHPRPEHRTYWFLAEQDQRPAP